MHPPKGLLLAAATGWVGPFGCGTDGGGSGSSSSPHGSNPPTFSISGAITGATGVTVNLTGAATGSTMTDGNGSYSLGSLANGNYTLTPSKPGFGFNPPNIAVWVNGGNLTGQNFTATAACSADHWCQRNPPQGGSLHGVWGSGPNDVWAVGGDGNGDGITLHWDGTAWTAVSSGTMYDLIRVWGSGANDVWAVGDVGTILHWDGSAWTSASSGTTFALFGVWGSGANDVWAVGDGTILERSP